MSGHSKWSKIKHQKGTTDALKGRIFTKMAVAIIMAVRHGGGNDPSSNFKLRLAMDKARSVNMPKEKIEHAIARGSGDLGEEAIEEALYEGFAPGGVGIIIEAATNKKQRTVSEIKNVLERAGGHLAQPGSVSHMFQMVGLIHVAKGDKSSDEIMTSAIEAGAIDFESEEGSDAEIYTEASKVHEVKEFLEKKGIGVSSFELYYRPTMSIPVTDKGTAERVLHLLSCLEELEDVQKVFANFDIPMEFLHHQ